MRNRNYALCLAAALVASCNRETPQGRAAQDARDVAEVEAAQTIRPPVQPLRPAPMSPAVREVFKLDPAGCEFRPETDGDADKNPGPVLVAARARAVLLLGGEPAIFAADGGSAELAPGIREKYVGRAYWAQLTRTPDTLTPYILTLRDRFERIVYQAKGKLTCHA